MRGRCAGSTLSKGRDASSGVSLWLVLRALNRLNPATVRGSIQACSESLVYGQLEISRGEWEWSGMECGAVEWDKEKAGIERSGNGRDGMGEAGIERGGNGRDGMGNAGI